MEMTLAKALKLKNKTINKISKLSADIVAYNSRLSVNEVEVDVEIAMQERKNLINQLVALKTAINKANAPVQENIFRMSELKGTIVFLQRIRPKHGRVMDGYDMEATDYVSAFKKTDIDEMIDNCQNEIDDIQDHLESFNQNTIINV